MATHKSWIYVNIIVIAVAIAVAVAIGVGVAVAVADCNYYHYFIIIFFAWDNERRAEPTLPHVHLAVAILHHGGYGVRRGGRPVGTLAAMSVGSRRAAPHSTERYWRTSALDRWPSSRPDGQQREIGLYKHGARFIFSG